jgi:hypothetical protein
MQILIKIDRNGFTFGQILDADIKVIMSKMNQHLLGGSVIVKVAGFPSTSKRETFNTFGVSISEVFEATI